MSDHWTENEDLLDRYALGRISPDERASLDRHLAACKPCSEKADLRRRAVESVRAFGRSQTKSWLAGEVSRRAETRSTLRWTLRAAAAVVVLVGIGILNRDMFRRGGETPTAMKEEQLAPKGAEPKAEENGAATAEKQSPATSPTVRDALSDAREKDGEKKARAEEAFKLELNDVQEAGKEKNGAAGKMAVAAPTPAAAGGGVPSAYPTDLAQKAAPAPTTESMAGGIAETVVDGTLLDATETSRLLTGPLEMNRSDAALRQSAVTQSAKTLSTRKLSRVEGTAAQQNFSVQNILPRQQNAMRGQQATRNTVETVVDTAGGTVNLYLNLQPPLTSREVQSARVTQINDDSVLVQVRNLNILYRLPSSRSTR